MEATSTFNLQDQDDWRSALDAQRPVLVHLNADTTWLIQLPYPPSAAKPPGRTHFNILLDPWLQGPQADVASWFSKQWHVVPPSVKTLAELSSLLGSLEGATAETNASLIDAVAISHEFTDHCHEATLRELPASTPVFATEKAADLIRGWRHFTKVTTTPGFSGATDDWKPLLSLEGLPEWVGIGRVITPGNALYYHSAVMVVFDLGSSSKSETILYSPHGIQASDLSCVGASGIKTLALLHGLHDVGIWMTKQLNLGALNGIQAVAESGAKYWIATHDEVKKGGGMIAPFIRRTKHTLKDAVDAETSKMGGKVPKYDFVGLGSGDGVVLRADDGAETSSK
ncbi:hypothetical protein F5X68DRAFT_247875 [Plectosphaerella plurivora]|uniref:Uncharacterized protein n=1 Tax=Plectosphaerella plurivora TaxID=936078 RepID=A0A9P8VJX6_9PEZI|nr:hypothetical protein F5X68DRAFT_247875 [Plectosphaerella plurivora]